MTRFDLKDNNLWLLSFNLFLFSLSVYLLTASVIVSNQDVGQLRMEVLESIVERLDLSVSSGVGIKGADGRDYSWFSIGSVLFALPFYLTGKLLGIPPGNTVNIMNQLVGAATVTLVFIFCVSLGYSKRASLKTSLFYGFGTIAWCYAKDSGEHGIETFFTLLSVYFICRYIMDKRKISRLFFSGLALGMAVITRPTSILIMPILFVLASLSSKDFDLVTTIKLTARNFAIFSITLFPFIIIFLSYNYYRFGSVFETGYTLIAARANLGSFFSGTPLLTGLSGFLISPGKGLFYYSPIALLFFFSIRNFNRKHPVPFFCFICIMVFYLLFFSRYLYWHGDFAWGPRFLFTITPFLIIPTAELIDSPSWHERPLLKKSVYALLAVSISVQLAAVSVNPLRYFVSLQTEKNVRFKVDSGNGVQPIIEPPAETYFDWHRSPILAQFEFVGKTARHIRDYQYVELTDKASYFEKTNVQPWMNAFDFWWVYKYFLEKTCTGFVGAAVLLLLAVYNASKLWKNFSMDGDPT